MNKAAFLDRDGVINARAAEGGYITRWEEVQFLPHAAQAIALLNQSNFRVIVVTNQRCVAKGLISIEGLQLLHQQMRDELAAAGAKVEAFYCCPHDLEPPCTCRKPEAGMLFDAAREHHISLPDSWMIGDSESDILAGKTAGCRTARISGEGGDLETTADVVAGSLLDAVNQLFMIGERRTHSTEMRRAAEGEHNLEPSRHREKAIE